MRVTVTPEQIQSAFEAVKDDPSFDESRGLWERGLPPVEMLQAMCLRPEILRAFAGFGHSVYPGGILERRVKELVIITASERNDCQFCTSSHCDLVDIAGIVEDPLGAIADPAALVARERIAIEYTRAAMANSNALRESLASQLHEHFTDPELVELSFLIGYINMLNLFNNLLGVRYNGEYSVLRPSAAEGSGSPGTEPRPVHAGPDQRT
ncbi:MAG: carboxymuconolactone decarboxylase family protein [Chloroflexota bacterium]